MQSEMQGPDWLSDPDKRSQTRAETARRKTARECAKRLHLAAD